MAMNIYEVVSYMPLVCISILLVIAVASEILYRRGITQTPGFFHAHTDRGYLYAAYDRSGTTYRFRIAANGHNSYQAYLEDAPAHIDTSSLRVDASGNRYIPARAASAAEAEQEAERFVRQQEGVYYGN